MNKAHPIWRMLNRCPIFERTLRQYGQGADTEPLISAGSRSLSFCRFPKLLVVVLLVFGFVSCLPGLILESVFLCRVSVDRNLYVTQDTIFIASFCPKVPCGY
jgi:hypothetical protein